MSVLRAVCGLLLACLCLAGPVQAGNTHGAGSLQTEMQGWFDDLAVPAMIRGCVPVVPGASLTLAAFACDGYVRSGSTLRLSYVTQVARAVGPLSGGNGTYWLILHADTSSAVGGWTRQAGTHYLWQLAAIQPTLPANSLWIARVIVTSGAISAVADITPRRAVNLSWYLQETNPLQAALTAVAGTGEKGALILVPPGIMIPVPTAVTTPTGVSRLAIECETPGSGFQWTGGNSATLLTIAAAANVSRIVGCTFNLNSTQTGVTFLKFAAGNTEEIVVMGNTFVEGGTQVEVEGGSPGVLLNIRSESNWYFDADTYAFRGPTVGGSIIGATFANDHFQGPADVLLQISGVDLTIRDSLFDISKNGDATGIQIASFDSLAIERVHVEAQGTHAGTVCMDIGTTALGTNNMSGGKIVANHFDCAMGNGLEIDFAHGVTIDNNTFRRTANAILMRTNARKLAMGQQVFADGVTQKQTEDGAPGWYRLDSEIGWRVPPMTMQSYPNMGPVTEDGAQVTHQTDTAGAITEYAIQRIIPDTGAGSIANLRWIEFANQPAGTHPSLGAVTSDGDAGWIKSRVNAVAAFIPMSRKAGGRKGVATLDGTTPTLVTLGSAEANTNFGVLITCNADVGDLWYEVVSTTTFNIQTDGAHTGTIKCTWEVVPVP